LCRCDCDSGLPVYVTIDALLYRGRKACSKSCAATVHGMATREGRDPIYNCWQGIVARCEHPGATGYENYGGRGIKLYGPWHDPVVFKVGVEHEIGPRPSLLHSIDRINPDGDYAPGNIRWLLKVDQPLNRRRMYNATEVAALLAEHHCGGCRCGER
jgi:hypothetical protein